MMDEPVIISDLGGTNGRMVLRLADGTSVRKDYRIADYPNLTAMLKQFLADTNTPPGSIASAVLAVCGPVWDGGRSNIHNNSHWIAAPNVAGDIERECGLPADSLSFLNDFEANGYALTALFQPSAKDEDARPTGLTTLHEAKADASAPFACVGAGTGLGCVYGVPHTASDGSPRHTVCSSEAGMTNTICPRDEREFRLLTWLKGKYGEGSHHIDVERIVSGPGLVDCYAFARMEAGTPLADDSAPPSPEEVAELARSGGDAAATQALRDFLSFYGRNLCTAACTFLPFAGLYVAGGILPKLAWAWKPDSGSGSGGGSGIITDVSWSRPGAPAGESAFLAAYLDAGPKMAELVARVPLILVDDPDIGLKGCLAVALTKAKASKSA